MSRATADPSQTPESKARERLKALSASLRRAAKHPGEAESIHRLRVAIRRFTQVLRVFGGQFEHTKKMRRSLRGLMDLCGEARNCDVALEVLEAAGVPPQPALKNRLKRRRVRAEGELAEQLKDGDLRASMRHWRGWLKTAGGPPEVKTPALASRNAAASWPPEFLQSGRAAARAGADFAQMHKFRLMVKKLRYTLELLGSGGAHIEELRGLQERLGSINDCVTTADLMVHMKLTGADRRRIKAALDRLLAQRAVEFRAHWRGHFLKKTAKRSTP